MLRFGILSSPLNFMKSDCNNFEILHESRMGYVSRCKHCGEIQVKIGTFYCKINEASFRGLCKEFQLRKKDFSSRTIQTPHGEHGLFAIAHRNLFLSLTELEYLETCDMLEIAQHMYDVNEILTP